ncbi:Fanconi anemia group D2 protein [Holothuria leucospilota]|uniref:Fanconi anemia group D2 protein n=1 Tax=Holothuria leucospilota TaxID=206669 RepID=A0A9Q1HEV1_HOLLE|nr:Fanconi anemia group D2 protein [Holothuria leucospilota]
MAKSKGKRLRNDPPNESKTSKKQKLNNSSMKGTFQDDSLFAKTVEMAGLTLSAGDKPNILNVDQAVFQKNVQKALKKQLSVSEAVRDFLEGLQSYTEDESRLKFSLLSSSASPDCESARSGQQDSLIRLLLKIEEVQPTLITILLEKLPVFMGEDDTVFDRTESANLPKLILSQFYWLDVVKAKEMTSKMTEMIEVCSPTVQHEIILCVPEVITDDEHNNVAKKLKELLEQNSDLTVSILNALSNLNVIPDLLKEVCQSALQTLDSARLEDLPIIVKFILSTVNNSNALEVIGQLRQSLDFTSSTTSTSTADQEKQRQSAADSEILVLETIKSSINSDKSIATAWIKSINIVDLPEDHRVIDIFVLLMVHGVAAHRKSVEGLLRKKLRVGCLTEELLEYAYQNHPKVMRCYFQSLLVIADKLIRFPEASFMSYATSVYRESFLAFDIHHKQEIIGALVEHVKNSSKTETDASLDFLLELVNSYPREVAPFTMFLKSILDDLHELSLPRIRKVFLILSGLTSAAEGVGTANQDELHIIVRKQLTNGELRYKRIGVIAALAIFTRMASKRNDDKPVSDATFKQITSLLDMVRSSISGYPEITGLFCDEMANIIQHQDLDTNIKKWIGESVLNDFQEDYVVDIEAERLTGEYGLPMIEMYGLEAEESQGDISVNLLPLVSKAETARLDTSTMSVDSRNRSVSHLCLTPQFRLLQICERTQRNGDLEGIDALLGCPLYSFKHEILEKLESLSRSEKELACSCLFVALNWFREVINAFAAFSDPELKAKVIGRIQHITELQPMLEKCLAATPGYQPPMATFDLNTPPELKISESGPSTSGKSKLGKKRKSKKEKENSPDEDNLPSSTPSQRQQDEDDNVDGDTDTGSVNIKKYQAFFRELDLDVFIILSSGLFSKSILDSEHHTKEVQLLQLQPTQLEFLLGDLLEKLKHSLSPAKKATFLQVKGKSNVGFSHLDQMTAQQVIKKVLKFLPAICQHLEATNSFIQTLVSQNDGMLDGPGTNSPEAQKMKSSFQLILDILLVFFSWDGFKSRGSLPLLEEALGVFGTKKDNRKNPTLSDLVKQCFCYFEKFSESVPNLACAVTLLKLLGALTGLTETQQPHKTIGSLSETFLKRDWFDESGEKCKGAKHNEYLQIVLRLHLNHSGDGVLQAIETICSTGVTELMNAGTKGSSTTFPTLMQSSFSSYYRVMFERLVFHEKGIAPFKAGDSTEVQSQKLVEWNMSARVMFMLISLIKVFDARPNLTTAIKCGGVFLDIFLRNGMPLLDLKFKTQREDVQSLLKSLQQSTRSLQYMCNHSKVTQDMAVSNFVPALKKILERFVYRVKVMLTLNNCHEAFWLGNLKNKDLKGEEISSQVCPPDEEEEDEEEEDQRQDATKLSEDSDDEDDDDDDDTVDERKAGNKKDDDESCSENY